MDVAERVRADRPSAGEGPLPPGLRWPASLQTMAMLFASRPFNGLCERRFDGIMTSRLVSLGEMVVVWDPDLIRQVFTGDPDVLCAGQANEPVLGRPVGPNSVIVLDGARHLRTRKLLLPAFHGDAVRGYRDLVADIAARDVERWPVGRPFAIHPHMQAITLEVILRAVIGTRDDERRAQLRSVLPGVAQANAAVLAAEARYPRVADSRLGRRLPWLRARRRAQTLFCEEIAAHRADPEGRDDILAALMAARDADGRALTDDELRDQLATLLIAGQETTATALAWCFERLVRHPAALDRLRSEIIAANGDDYLGAVISETLRVRPVVDAVWRKLTAPIDLGGYRLPAGTVIAPSILGAHRTAFAEPDAFRPRTPPRSTSPALHPDPVRRRHPPLHRRELRAHGDEDDPAHRPRTRRSPRPDRQAGAGSPRARRHRPACPRGTRAGRGQTGRPDHGASANPPATCHGREWTM